MTAPTFNTQNLKIVKQTSDFKLTKPNPRKIKEERMKLFMSMSPSDLKPKPKKPLACEKALEELPKPVDRIRCPHCGILSLREEHINHVKFCTGTAPTIMYGCTDCSFKHFDIEVLRDHISTHHKK